MRMVREETLRRNRLADKTKPVLVVTERVWREINYLNLADQRLQLQLVHDEGILEWVVLVLHVELLVLHLQEK